MKIMKIMGKAKDFLNSPSGKKTTGQALDKAEKFATGKLSADKATKIRKARGMVDKRLGTGSTDPTRPKRDTTERSTNRNDQPGSAGGSGQHKP